MTDAAQESHGENDVQSNDAAGTDHESASAGRPPLRWRERVVLLGLGAVAGAAAVALTGVTHGASEEHVPQASSPAAPEREHVQLSPELAQHAHLRIEDVVEAPVSPSIEVVGTIALDPERVASVGPQVVGRVARYFVELGGAVEAGAPLVRLETAEMGAVIADWLAARAELEAVRTRLERQRSLFANQLATAAELEQTRADFASFAARATGAEHRLLTMGLTRPELERISRGGHVEGITLRASTGGEVIERPIALGEVVEPSDAILRVADLDTVWALFDVYERDLPSVREGDAVEVRTEGSAEPLVLGRVEHVGSIVDEETRTGRIRVSLDNRARALRPGQYVHARLSREHGRHVGILVPRSAILQLGGEPAAFVALSETEYELRPLRLGSSMGDRVEVVAGVANGERVVVEGAFALKSELQR